MTPNYDYTFKVMMLGDASVGKTSLTVRYISGSFLEDLRLTIGVDFYSKTTEYENKKVRFQMWDFGGEIRFRYLLSQYCKGANGAFFLYDITNSVTLSHLPDWTNIIREVNGDIPIILIGSKLDLDEFRAVSREEGEITALKYNLNHFLELSSKTGENIEKAFDLMTESLFEKFILKKRTI